MAEQAEQLLAGSSWLPEKLRTQGQVFTAAADVQGAAHRTRDWACRTTRKQHEADMPTGGVVGRG